MLLPRIIRYARHATVRHPLFTHAGASRACGKLAGDGVESAGGKDTVLKIRVKEEEVPEVVRRALAEENMSRSEKRGVKLREMIVRYRRSDQDTGSPEVQIALWTEKIRDLTGHVNTHRKDKENVRRLVMMVHKRRRMMRYLLRESPQRYRDLVTALGLRPGSVFGKDLTRGAKKAATPRLHLHD